MESTSTAALLADLCREGALERIYKRLRAKIPSVSVEDVQDAVGHAVLSTLTACQSEPPRDPSSYLFSAAKNHLLRVIKARGRLAIDDVDPDTRSDLGSGPDGPYGREDLYRWFRGLVARWDNERMRTVIELWLDAAREDVSMTGQELAAEAEAITGESFSLSSVYEWLNRGLRKLHEELERTVNRDRVGDRQDD